MSSGVKRNFFVTEVAKSARYAIPSVGYLTKLISKDEESESDEVTEEVNLKSAVTKWGRSVSDSTKGVRKKALGIFSGIKKAAEGAVNKDTILQTYGKFRNLVNTDYVPPGTLERILKSAAGMNHTFKQMTNQTRYDVEVLKEDNCVILNPKSVHVGTLIWLHGLGS
jgi:hypothetical protein